MKSTRAMKRIGVTGGIGSGKSEVCRILAANGCAVFNADEEAKALQETDPEVIAAIKKLFGDSIYGEVSGEAPDETLGNKNSGKPRVKNKMMPDRKRLAEIIFSDAEKLSAMNRLLHPRVRRVFTEKAAAAETAGYRAFVKEAAILYESGADAGLDAVIAVAADLDIRMQRVLARGGITEENARKRIAHQLPQEELLRRTPYRVWNNGTKAELEAAVKQTFEMILQA